MSEPGAQLILDSLYEAMLSFRQFVVGAAAAVIMGGGAYLASEGADTGPPDPVLPLADQPYVVTDDLSAYRRAMMSGGPPPDGIPAIDNPEFLEAADANLDPNDKVIGYYHNGEARAYPQNIMVYHEIVNDRVGGKNVAVTYCPLTATSQGFKRGETTLGVSGQLLNSNLVLFDRETESYFSQINATGLQGTHEGETLDEVNLYWTTWERWQNAHPDTKVLSENTGHVRNYNNDPYGSYNPIGGYYQSNNVMFPLMHESNRHHNKEMVVGARTSDASVYFLLEDLESERVQHTGDFVAVYDERLDTGYIYATAEGANVTALDDGTYEVDGQSYAAGELPFDQLVAVEAFHFAWYAFYPDSDTV